MFDRAASSYFGDTLPGKYQRFLPASRQQLEKRLRHNNCLLLVEFTL